MKFSSVIRFVAAITLILMLISAIPISAGAKDYSQGMKVSDMGTKYYISNSAGSDSNDGLSPESPWKTFTKINEMVLTPGDCVLLARGDVWYNRLVIRGNGTADNYVFVGSYGDIKKPMPQISLENGYNDIGILVSDICSDVPSECGLNYIWIDNIKVSDTYLGIYFRYAVSTSNVGIRVTNCRFENINCTEVMEKSLTNVGAELAAVKGNLKAYDGTSILATGGGAREYVWPTAINIGGRTSIGMTNIEVPGCAMPQTKISEIELYNNYFNTCVMAVGANSYGCHYGWGSNQCRQYTAKWRIKGLTAENTLTMLNIDSADFGYDGTDVSEWGIWENISSLSGMTDVSMSMGTTQALFSSCENLCIRNSQFSNCRNNNQPDGCGFDFERDDHNFLLESCIFANNEGQGILMMQTTQVNNVTGNPENSPNSDCTIKNCLFYNNMTNVFNNGYCHDFLVFNDDNTNINLTGNTFCFREKTSGLAECLINSVIASRYKFAPVGPLRKGVTQTDSIELRGSDMPTFEDAVNNAGLTAATVCIYPVDRIYSDYDGIVTEETTEPETTVIEPVTTEPETTEPATTEPVTTAKDTTAMTEIQPVVTTAPTETTSTDITTQAQTASVSTDTEAPEDKGCGAVLLPGIALTAAAATVIIARKKKNDK